MKAPRRIGRWAIAYCFLGSQALAQTPEHVAALDPAVAPATGASAEAPSTVSTPPATSPEPPTPPTPEPPATPPQALPPAAGAPPVTLGFSGVPRDAAASPPSSRLPIRAQRKLALLGEVGWNGLAGSGLVLTYNAHPHVAFDLAGGLSLTGWKAGLRGRYNLLTGPFTPFVGAGASLSSGWDGARLGRRRYRDREGRDDFDFDPKEEGKYDVKRSEFAQAVVGFEFIHRHGFTVQGTAGYSWVLNQNNYTFVAGKRDDALASALFGSGPVVSAAFGYAFN